MLQNRWRLACVALVGVIGIVAGLALAAQGDSEVRVAVARLDDGRVEVAVQQRSADGWGERQLPEQRFLPADSSGEWLVSSAVGVKAEPNDALNCIVHHGTPGDPFWRAFNRNIDALALRVGLAGVEIHAEPDVHDQAAAIADCAARGARSIATTIPSAEALQGAATTALESGVSLYSFNSGADLARSLGSLSHVGLDDQAAGRIAGQQFNAAEVNATVLCVVHEPDNVGLANRCDGLASTFGGDVQRLDLSPASLVDSAAAAASIAGAADTHNAGAILVLNSALVAPAVAAADGRVVGAVGAGSISLTQALLEGDVLFAVDPASAAQARALIGLMLTQSDQSELSGASRISLGGISGTGILLISPRVMTGEWLRILIRENPALLERQGLVESAGN